ncbi:class I SAM-dependent methyltransferase [Steroidobacter flavus]|uniref:Class I SAM-dependent methyltransferase n=1 Tax=Steroidobacter flavus TaxID=1842136 RepID=A0ABV8SN85_9GAMM
MTETAQTPDPLRCRLCDGALAPRFSLRVLEKHDVAYLQCEQCQSLQTEPPYWLDEAYRDNNLSNLDTGAVQRNLQNLAACWSMAKLLGLKNVLDIGGGDGLLCRLLRDYEINCYVHDRYAKPTYAQGFEHPDFATPELIVAFEVLEHYPQPRDDLDALFKQGPKAVLASTGIYTNQGQDWWYLAPQAGQHIFFYSRRALGQVARKYGYDLLVSGGYLLFLRSGVFGGMRPALAKLMLKSNARRWTKALLVMRSAKGVWKDHTEQVEQKKSGARR